MTDHIHTTTLSEEAQRAFESGRKIGFSEGIRSAAEKISDKDFKAQIDLGENYCCHGNYLPYNDCFDCGADAIRALSMPTPTQGWTVKPLEWKQGTWSGQPAWFADCLFGCWSVIDQTIHGNGIGVDDPSGNLHEEDYATIEEAKAAAQADYARRISAAILTTPPEDV